MSHSIDMLSIQIDTKTVYRLSFNFLVFLFFPHFLCVLTKMRMIETHADLCSKMRDFHVHLYLHK